MTKHLITEKEERSILSAAERGRFKSVKNLKKHAGFYSAVAKRTLEKKKVITIRLSELDLLKLKARAVAEGVPYQTLISASVHKFVQ